MRAAAAKHTSHQRRSEHSVANETKYLFAPFVSSLHGPLAHSSSQSLNSTVRKCKEPLEGQKLRPAQTLTMMTITSRLAYYQTRLHSSLSVCNLWSPCVCMCVCVPSAANELCVSRVQVWECLVYTGGQVSLLFVIRTHRALLIRHNLVCRRARFGLA